MSSRTEARREILQKAHEGHEEYHPKIRVKRVGPRRWFSSFASSRDYGYDYFETIRNWEVSRAQLIGFLVTLAGVVVILVVVLYLGSRLQ